MSGLGAIMKNILAAIVSVAWAGTAFAADMPAVPYSRAAPYISPAYNWTGFYIGAMGGYGWSDEVRASIGGGFFSTPSKELKRAFAGGTGGHNWQKGRLGFGGETDGAW